MAVSPRSCNDWVLLVIFLIFKMVFDNFNYSHFISDIFHRLKPFFAISINFRLRVLWFTAVKFLYLFLQSGVSSTLTLTLTFKCQVLLWMSRVLVTYQSTVRCLYCWCILTRHKGSSMNSLKLWKNIWIYFSSCLFRRQPLQSTGIGTSGIVNIYQVTKTWNILELLAYK